MSIGRTRGGQKIFTSFLMKIQVSVQDLRSGSNLPPCLADKDIVGAPDRLFYLAKYISCDLDAESALLMQVAIHCHSRSI